ACWSSHFHVFGVIIRRPSRSTPFPYTTLFRSQSRPCREGWRPWWWCWFCHGCRPQRCWSASASARPAFRRGAPREACGGGPLPRSEEHTSELQSRENLVCRLLLEKKKQDCRLY